VRETVTNVVRPLNRVVHVSIQYIVRIFMYLPFLTLLDEKYASCIVCSVHDIYVLWQPSIPNDCHLASTRREFTRLPHQQHSAAAVQLNDAPAYIRRSDNKEFDASEQRTNTRVRRSPGDKWRTVWHRIGRVPVPSASAV
jgi:hypothetical protein